MVDDGKHTVIGQPHDQVHGYLGKRGGVTQDTYFVQGDTSPVGEVLVLLAGYAPFYILFYLLLCIWPVELPQYLPYCLILPRVTTQPVMVGVHYLFLQQIVWRYNQLTSRVHPGASPLSELVFHFQVFNPFAVVLLSLAQLVLQ
jgi:hypothetical protein